MDCQSLVMKFAAFLWKSGFRGLVFRRQGKLLRDGASMCLRNFHEWLELPDQGIVVLDFETNPPIVLDAPESEEYVHQGLHYTPDPYRRYKGVWNARLQAFDWHLAPATDLISQ